MLGTVYLQTFLSISLVLFLFLFHAGRSEKLLDDGLVVAAALCAASRGGPSRALLVLDAAAALHFFGDGVQAVQKSQLHLLD